MNGPDLAQLRVKRARGTAEERSVEALFDSGAVYSLVSGDVLRELGITPDRSETFTLADGTHVTRQVGEAFVELNGRSATVPVNFGEPGDDNLVGVTTLELMGLVLDPFQRRLQPMRLRL